MIFVSLALFCGNHLHKANFRPASTRTPLATELPSFPFHRHPLLQVLPNTVTSNQVVEREKPSFAVTDGAWCGHRSGARYSRTTITSP